MPDGFPIGAVIAFPGEVRNPPVDPQFWLLCDGAPLGIASYDALFAVIGFTYGGSQQQQVFRLPDYRGRFLRGADAGSGVDPDAERRRAHWDESPHLDGTPPLLAGGNVGSIQGSATAIPHTHFKTYASHLPNDVKATAHTWDLFKPPSAAKYKYGSRKVDTCTEGGDAESRPVNLYVNFFIRVR